MISKFLKKQKDIHKKRKLIKTMIFSLKIPEKQKSLYLESLNILDINSLNDLYNNLAKFIENIEIREIEEINKENFTNIVGMRKKEAEEKKQDLNAFSFLIHNI